VKKLKMSEIKFAIPKGSLEAATFKLLERSWTKVNRKDRTYRVYLDDPNIIVKMLRPQEIPTMVAEGLYDVGITGKDWVGETNSDVEQILDLKLEAVVKYSEEIRNIFFFLP
jgi:ATP phosphoribosyltransferase